MADDYDKCPATGGLLYLLVVRDAKKKKKVSIMFYTQGTCSGDTLYVRLSKENKMEVNSSLFMFYDTSSESTQQT